MRTFMGFCLWFLVLLAGPASAQVPQIDPRLVTKTGLDEGVTTVEVAPRFVTAIRVPAPVSSVALGDPGEFQAEHSGHESDLVFVKAISSKPAETNLLISTIDGHEFSLLLISRGEGRTARELDVSFLVRYEPARGFLVAQSGFPFALVGETLPLAASIRASSTARAAHESDEPGGGGSGLRLDDLLKEQESSPLPVLFGGRRAREPLRAGVGRVIDGGERVIVLFSVVNLAKDAILLMPPQVQLAGRTRRGEFLRHATWVTAEQLPVLDYRLSRRRLEPGGRADGVAEFRRPPYKQSNEALLLQITDSGAVDRPVLAPMGFGVNSSEEDWHGRGN